jgi:bifunctional DNA-binding transcriptional regulator/antitoxin component of YhaV-PrlF toxin-antitoxin module
VRKLQKTDEGRQSYMITLPKETVRDLGWRENQKLTVEQAGEIVIIKDWEESK